MEVKEKDDQRMHSRLPIGENEKILGIYKHHWFAYASVWFFGIFLVVIILGLAIFLTTNATDPGSGLVQHKAEILSAAAVFSGLVLVFTGIPVWLRSQEQVVLTEEALLQILQPTIFANKISQLNLRHLADVSVRQDFLGSLLGFGKISIETPGEQDNYEFVMLPNPQNTAKQIIEAHENYQAALESGRMPTTLGTQSANVQAPAIDPQQYQQFLAYEQMAAAQNPAQPVPPVPAATPPEPAQSEPPVTVDAPQPVIPPLPPLPPTPTPPAQPEPVASDDEDQPPVA